MTSRFPVAFPLPAFRFSVIRCPPRSWALLTVGLPDVRSRPDLDGVTAFRTFELRPGWVPPIPRGRRCSSRPRDVLGRRLPLFRGESFNPAPTFPSTRGSELRGISQRFRSFTRPACPSPVAPGWVGRPWASPRASHPAVTGGARRGQGQVVEHGPGTTRSPQLILQSGSSLVSCDRRRTVEPSSLLEGRTARGITVFAGELQAQVEAAIPRIRVYSELCGTDAMTDCQFLGCCRQALTNMVGSVEQSGRSGFSSVLSYSLTVQLTATPGR
jgi:hypothetical protein